MRQHGQRSFTAAIKNMESRVLTTHFFVAATIRPPLKQEESIFSGLYPFNLLLIIFYFRNTGYW
jgi:hypothetical protein